MSGHQTRGLNGRPRGVGTQDLRPSAHANEGAGERCRSPRPSRPPTWGRFIRPPDAERRRIVEVRVLGPRLSDGSIGRSLPMRSIEDAGPSIDHALRLRQDGEGVLGHQRVARRIRSLRIARQSQPFSSTCIASTAGVARPSRNCRMSAPRAGIVKPVAVRNARSERKRRGLTMMSTARS